MPELFGQAGKHTHQPTGLGAARRGEGVCVCVCARCDGHGGVLAFIREVSLSAGACCCLLAYLQYIMCDRWVMEEPPPPHSLHSIVSAKSASRVLIGARRWASSVLVCEAWRRAAISISGHLGL